MIQSVARAGQILLALGDGRPLGVTELARRLGLAKPTVHGLVRTLVADGLVEQDPGTGRYQLGLAVLRLGSTVLANHPLRARAPFWVDALATGTGQSAQVGVLDGGHVVILHGVDHPGAQPNGQPDGQPDGHRGEAGQRLGVGSAVRWDACALGTAIVAHLPPADPRRPHSHTAQLDRIAATGVAVDDQRPVAGEASLAAPVFAAGGQVAGAMGITGPAYRLVPDGPAPELAAAVRDCARGLSGDLASHQR